MWNGYRRYAVMVLWVVGRSGVQLCLVGWVGVLLAVGFLAELGYGVVVFVGDDWDEPSVFGCCGGYQFIDDLVGHCVAGELVLVRLVGFDHGL